MLLVQSYILTPLTTALHFWLRKGRAGDRPIAQYRPRRSSAADLRPPQWDGICSKEYKPKSVFDKGSAQILPLGHISLIRLRDVAAQRVLALFAGRILPFDSAAAREFAQIVADRRHAGQSIDDFDAQIAAIAQRHTI